jgi:hypothetical protein
METTIVTLELVILGVATFLAVDVGCYLWLRSKDPPIGDNLARVEYRAPDNRRNPVARVLLSGKPS